MRISDHLASFEFQGSLIGLLHGGVACGDGDRVKNAFRCPFQSGFSGRRENPRHG
jgi:hypothetical protein